MSVTIEELKSEIPEYAYETISGGSDAVGLRALEKARNWIKAKTSGCNNAVYNEDDETIKEIVLKRALYELYEYNDQEGIAKDKKNDAYELLRAKYGACIDSTNQADASSSSTGSKVSGGSIIKRERNTEAF